LPNAARYQIRLVPAPDGQLRWAPASRDADGVEQNHQQKNPSGCHRKVFYDDGRGRQIIYEVDFERDCFRYVLERDDHNDGKVQRLVFPTLQAAVFCLAGCINRNE
jgi:hypothetical protein